LIEENTPSTKWILFSVLSGPLFLVIWFCVVPPISTPPAHALLGVLIFTLFWWLTEPIPIPITGLLGVVLAVMLGATPAPRTEPDGRARWTRLDQEVLAPFADPSLIFLLGGLFLGRAMTRHGLDRRLALSILSTNWASRSPSMVLVGMGLSVTILSMGISNTAATAMMYPVTLGIIMVLATGADDPRFSRSPYASSLLLMTAYAASVGGVATPIGTPTNITAFPFLGGRVNFLQWIQVGMPVSVILFLGLSVWMMRSSPQLDLAQLRVFLKTEYAKLGPWKVGEWSTLAVFLCMIVLWIAPGVTSMFADDSVKQLLDRRVPETVMALLVPVLLFLMPADGGRRCLEVDDLGKVDWGTMLLFGSGLALGKLMFETGLADQLGRTGYTLLGTKDVWVLTALSILAAIVLSEFTSNVATATTLLPVVKSICEQAELDAAPPLLGVTLGASFGSTLPVSTPPNAIVYASGLLPVRRMVVAGLGFDVLCFVVIWIVLRCAFGLGWRP
jgi:sodium-dependent dicarboxylate transporter 2/3/5